MSTGLMASLSKFPDNGSLHGKIGTWNLDEGGGHRRHDKGEEQGVALFSSRMQIGHEGGFVDAGSERIHKVKEKGNDE